MHERSRRNLCKILFLALCVAPTCGTLSWAAYRVSPLFATAEKAAWEAALFAHTGLLATVSRVEHPGGGSTLLVGVELTDPDGGDRVVKLRQAELAPTPQGLVVLLSQPEVSQGKFLRLCDTLHDRVLRGPPPTQPVQITAGELTLEVGGRAQTFTLLRCTISSDETGVKALFDFQVAGWSMPAPAELAVERNRQISPPETSWKLQSATPIPCALFTDYLPALDRLGNQCLFQGTVHAVGCRGDWSVDVTGGLSQLDLATATEPFPHRLSGVANVTLHKMIVQRGVLVEAMGEVTCGGGTVSTSLLEALAEQLPVMLPIPTRQLPRPQLRYDQLACGFSLAANGIRLRGQCPGGATGVMMMSRAGDLLVSDAERIGSLASAVRALSPASESLVPATDASRQLISVLALPTQQSTAPIVAEIPRVRVRWHNGQSPPDREH